MTNTYRFTLKTQAGHWEIGIDPVECYGYIEDDRNGNGGGLWFDANKTLIDYDGVFALPNKVIAAIEALGYNVDYAKDNGS